MERSEIEARVKTVLPEAEIEIDGAECDFTVTLISETFAGMLPVKRQQMVLAAFADLLASGALHALSVKPFTVEEWNSRYTGLVQIGL